MIWIVFVSVAIAGFAWYKKIESDKAMYVLCEAIIENDVMVEDNGDGTYNIYRKP